MNSHNPEHDDSSRRSQNEQRPESIDTDDPVITSGPVAQGKMHPNATMVVETDQIHDVATVPNPAVPMVPVDDSEPASKRGGDDRRQAAPAAPSMTKTLLFAALVALVCGVAGAWGYSHFLGGSNSEDQQSSKGSDSQKSQNKSNQKSDSKPSDASSTIADTGKEIPGFTRADDAETLRAQNQHLAERIDRLSERIDKISPSRYKTPPDLRTLQITVGKLAETVQNMGNLPTRFRTLENRLEDLDQKLKTLQNSTTHARPIDSSPAPELPQGPMSDAQPSGAPVPELAPETSLELLSAPDPVLTQGIRLFHDGQYAAAQDMFRKLRLTRPQDARVWYFSALSRGLLTGDWSDETRQMVARGLQLEKSGQPPTPKVDASLDGLTKAQGKDWLASLRAPALARR